MGDINNAKRNTTQLEERNDPFDILKKESNGKVNIAIRKKTRPIPDVIPRFPSDLKLPLNVKGICNDTVGVELCSKLNLNNKDAHNNVSVSDQGVQMGGNTIPPNETSCPYVLTLLPPSVGQNVNSPPRIHPPYSTGQFVQSASPFVRVPLVDPMYYQNQCSYQYGYRMPALVRNADNVYWNHQQMYRSKPGSVYGIPPEPRVMQSEYHRMNRQFNLLLQPNAVRVFNDYKSNLQKPVVNEQEANNVSPRQKCADQKFEDPKDNMTVHIGGLLTLPRSLQTYSDESSQSSTSSSRNDDESTKIAFTLPGMAEFKKMAHTGCRDLERLIAKYNVKSSKVDLEEFCKAVKANLVNTSPGLIQMEPVLREIILAFLHISSSWVSLASLLPVSKEQPNPLDSSLEPLAKEFQQWQEISKTMLEKISLALHGIPNEHERYVSGAYKKNVNPRNTKPIETDVPMKVSENWPTVNEWQHFSRQNSQRENHQQPNPISPRQNMRTQQNSFLSYSYPNDNSQNEKRKNSNLPLAKEVSSNLRDWDTPFGSTIIYPQQYGNKKSQDGKKTSPQSNRNDHFRK